MQYGLTERNRSGRSLSRGSGFRQKSHRLDKRNSGESHYSFLRSSKTRLLNVGVNDLQFHQQRFNLTAKLIQNTTVGFFALGKHRPQLFPMPHDRL